MDLQIAKWGNSLALRIPAEWVRQLGLREGATVDAQLTADGGVAIRPAAFDRRAFADELAKAHAEMPMTESVMDELRRNARY